MQSHPCHLSRHLFLYTFSRSYTDSLIYLRVNSRSATRACGVVDGVVDGVSEHQVKFQASSQVKKSFASISWEKLHRMFKQPNHSLVFEPTHLKNMSVKMGIFSK